MKRTLSLLLIISLMLGCLCQVYGESEQLIGEQIDTRSDRENLEDIIKYANLQMDNAGVSE